MELDKLLISTGVDALIKLVYRKKKIELEQAAVELNLPFKVVEEWAHILEDQGIIKIEYQFTKIYLVWVGGPGEEFVKRLGNIEEQKERIQKMLDEAIARIEAKGSELELIESEYKKLLSMFDPKITELSKRIAKIDEIKKQADEWYAEESDKISALKKTLTELKEGLSEFQNRWDSLKKEITSPKMKLESLKQLRAIETDLDKKMKETTERLDRLERELNKQKKKYEKVLSIGTKMDVYKKEIESVKQLTDEIRKEVGEIKKKQSAFDRVIKKLGKSPKQAISNLEKRLKTLKGTVPEIRAQLDDIEDKIEEQSRMLGDLALAYEQLESEEGKRMYDSLISKEKELNEQVKELRSILNDINRSATYRKKVESAYQQITDLEDKIVKAKEDLIRTYESSKEELDLKLANLKRYRDEYERLKETAIFYSNRNKDVMTELDAMLNVLDEKQKELMEEINKQKESIDREASKLYLAVQKYKSVLSRRAEIDDILKTIQESKKIRDQVLDNLKLLSKKLRMVKVLKGKEEEAAKELEEIEKEFRKVEPAEKELDEKRKKLEELVESMWKDEE